MVKPLMKHLVKMSLLLAVAGGMVSCKQYEYLSPLPGILEVRLVVKNTRSTIIPFTDFSRFNIIIKDFVAQRADGAFLVLLADLNAIRRKANEDSLNCLIPAARDSQMVLGIAYAPPGTYSSPISELTTAVKHDPFVSRFDGTTVSLIPVEDHYSVPQQFIMLAPSPSFEVKEGRRTIVFLTLDLDQSLVRRTEVFEWFAPMVYVSSIQNL